MQFALTQIVVRSQRGNVGPPLTRTMSVGVGHWNHWSASLHYFIVLSHCLMKEVKASALSCVPLSIPCEGRETLRFHPTFLPWPRQEEPDNSPSIDKSAMGIYTLERRSTNTHLCFAWYCVKLCMRLGKEWRRASISCPPSLAKRKAYMNNSV